MIAKLAYNGVVHLVANHLARAAARGAHPMRGHGFPPALCPQPEQNTRSDVPASVAAAGWVPLPVMRAICGALALGALGLYAAAIPVRYAELLTPCIAESCPPGRVVPGTLGSIQADAGLGTYAGALVALDAAFALVYLAIALLIFWRRSNDRVALFASLSLMLWGLTFTHTMTALLDANHAWFLPVESVRFLGAALITLFFYLFPDGRFVPAWSRWLAAIWVLSQVPSYFWPGSALDFNHWPAWQYYIISVAFLGVMIGLQVHRYLLVSSATQRRQTKWVVYGIGLALAGYLLVLLSGFLMGPRPGRGEYVLYAAALDGSLLPVPIAIGISVLRAGLFDIDLLINRSLIYATLTGVVVILYAGSVFAFSWLARALTGQQTNSLAIVASTLGVAALVQPLRRR
jgi:hypothetical protein